LLLPECFILFRRAKFNKTGVGPFEGLVTKLSSIHGSNHHIFSTSLWASDGLLKLGDQEPGKRHTSNRHQVPQLLADVNISYHLKSLPHTLILESLLPNTDRAAEKGSLQSEEPHKCRISCLGRQVHKASLIKTP
jgi:hypothetical protein